MSKRYILAFALLCVAAVLSGCRRTDSDLPASTDWMSAEDKISGVLIVPSTEWSRDAELLFAFAVLNGTGKDVRVDGRLEWPGNVDLLARLPDGRLIRALQTAVKMSRPTMSDVVTLGPEKLHGRRFKLDPRDKDVNPALLAAPRGRYVFWVAYDTPGEPSVDCEELSLTSNKITVLVD